MPSHGHNTDKKHDSVLDTVSKSASTNIPSSSTTAFSDRSLGGFTDINGRKSSPRNYKKMPHTADITSASEFSNDTTSSLRTGYADTTPALSAEASASGTGNEELGAGAMRAWLFSDLRGEFAEQREFQEGDTVDIQIMRVGKWNHALYGKVEVSENTLTDVVKNFKEDKRGIELAVDENHEPNHKALAWFKNVYKRGKEEVFATLELTKRGAELLTEGAYKYFSPEIIFKKQDEESGSLVKNLLVGGAFTNRPFFKRMTPLMANEDGATVDHQNSIVIFTNSHDTMKGFMEKLSALNSKESITTEEFNELKASYETLEEAHKESYSELVSEMEAKVGLFAEEGEEEAPAEEKAEEPKEEEAKEEAPEAEAEEEKEEEAEEPAAEEEAPEAVEVAATEEVSSAEFNEMKSQVRAMQKELAQKNRALRFSENEQKTRGFVFSESNKEGVLAPAMINKVAAFATNLSEKDATEFFSILEGVRTDLSAKTEEIGATGSITESFSEVKDFYTGKMGFSEEQADLAVAEYKKQLGL